MKKIFFLSLLAILSVLIGCKTNTHLLKCPDISSVKKHHETWAKAKQHRPDRSVVSKFAEVKGAGALSERSEAVASADESFKIKLPGLVTRKLNEEELQETNDIFVKYSANSVKLEKNEKGKIYLRANSKSDFFALVKSFAEVKKSSVALPGGGGGGFAIAGGILGIIAIILSLGPYVSYSAFLLGLLAIIFGVIGLHSGRPGWAITGIVLGALAILFAGVLGIGIYTIVLHI